MHQSESLEIARAILPHLNLGEMVSVQARVRLERLTVVAVVAVVISVVVGPPVVVGAREIKVGGGLRPLAIEASE